MGTYTPSSFMLPNGLDEMGYDLGLRRLPDETLSHFRRRLIQEAREPSGASQEQFIRSLNRQAGLLDEPIFDIDVIRDANEEPLAADPRIEVTSSWLRVYSDYDNGTLDFELNLMDRATGYFLRDVEAAFTASTYFSITVLPTTTDYQFYRSDHLRYGNTDRVAFSEPLRETRSNRLKNDLIKDLRGQAFQLFQNEVASSALVVEPGDYFIDYTNGVLFTEDIGSGFVTYTYREFPYTMYWQPVNVFPLADADIDYRHKNTLIDDDTGLATNLVLNSEGARITNNVLQVHPLGWGK